MRDIVYGVLVKPTGEVLLGYRAAFKQAYPNCWDLLGGHVETGESLDHALVREFREELGITLKAFARAGFMLEPNPDVNGLKRYHLYIVETWEGEPSNASDEHTEVGWFTADEALALTPLSAPARQLLDLRQAGRLSPPSSDLHDIVCALVLDPGGKVLLGQRAPHKRAYANCWDLFGGHVEAGESLEAALMRELHEELGIKPTSFESLGSMVEANPELNGCNLYHFYAVSAWAGEPTNASDEHTRIGWFTPDEAMALEPFVPDSRSMIAARARFV